MVFRNLIEYVLLVPWQLGYATLNLIKHILGIREYGKGFLYTQLGEVFFL